MDEMFNIGLVKYDKQLFILLMLRTPDLVPGIASFAEVIRKLKCRRF